jgi:alkylation response protein AidB-like acyl-CoA dehydrogenase
LRALVTEMMSNMISGKDIGGAASVVKQFYAQVLRDFTALGLRADSDAHLWAPFTLGAGHETGNWSFDYMNSFMWSIAGGSNEIQRNIISERVLGMPREKSA